MVGVPAREVIVPSDEEEKVHVGDFEAYGVSSPVSDPVEVRLNTLIKKIQQQDREIKTLKKKLNHKDN